MPLEAHEIVIEKVGDAVTKTATNRDDGANDLLMSDLLRANELQLWIVAEHLVDVPVVRVRCRPEQRAGGRGALAMTHHRLVEHRQDEWPTVFRPAGKFSASATPGVEAT